MAKEGGTQLAFAIGGAIIGGFVGQPQLGFMVGSILGAVLFPPKTKKGDMPTMAGYPVQRTNKGTPLAIVYGTERIAGNVIWMGPLQPYTIKHKSGGGKGGGGGSTMRETAYRRSFLISLCSGTAKIIRAWQGKTEIVVSSFTRFDGFDNQGISALTGEDFSDYKHECCAFFTDWDLGSTQQIPNFVFEVSQSGDPLGPLVCTPNTANRLTIEYEIENVMDAGGVCFACDVHRATGRYLISRNPDVVSPREPIVVFDRDDNNLNIHFDSTGSSDWTAHDVILAARFSKDGKYIYAEEKRIVYSSVLWKWDSTDGTLIWRLVIGGSSWALETDSRDYVYRIRASFVPDWDDYLERRSPDDGSIVDTWRNAVAPYDLFIDEDMKSTIGGVRVLKKGKMLCIGGDPHHPEIHVALCDLNDTTDVVTAYTDGTSAFSGVILNDYIYVLSKQTIYKFDYALTLINKKTMIGIDSAGHIAIAPGNRLYVTGETGTSVPRVLVYDVDLNLENTFEPRNASFPSEMWTCYGEPDSLYLYKAGEHGGDVNPADIIYDLITSEQHGAGIDTSLVNKDTFDDVWDYCYENDFLISLVIDSQRPLVDWLDYILSHFRGFIYMSNGKICLDCFKSEASVAAIGRGDLVIEEGENPEPPVQIQKRFYNETINRIEILWVNRSKDYDASIATAMDAVDQRVSSVRKKTIQLSGVKRASLANKLRYIWLLDSMYRYTMYKFTLTYKNMLLEPGDVITLSDGFLITDEKVRILSISEDKDGRGLAVEAIEDLSELYASLAAITAQESSWTPESDVTLADAANVAFREHPNVELLLLSLTPGNEYTNGWYVYRSYDDESYELVGQASIDGITGGDANSVGTLVNNLVEYPNKAYRGSDVMVVDIGTVTDLATDITDEDFLNGRKFLRVDEEIIGYYECVETATEGIWEITGLIRGMFNTKPVVHVPGESVETLDVDFSYIYEETDIGQTLYFKVLSYYSTQIQEIADVSAVSHTVTGKYKTPLPVSLMRINGWEGLETYKTSILTVDWYFCSKTSGYGRGGWGITPWGAYDKDDSVDSVLIRLLETDGTVILSEVKDLGGYYSEEYQVLITAAERAGKDPIDVEISAIGDFISDTRMIRADSI